MLIITYRSLNFDEKIVKKSGDGMYHTPASIVNYPSAKYDFNRIVGYKHFLKQKSADTMLYYKRSNDDGEPNYPVPPTRKSKIYTKDTRE